MECADASHEGSCPGPRFKSGDASPHSKTFTFNIHPSSFCPSYAVTLVKADSPVLTFVSRQETPMTTARDFISSMSRLFSCPSQNRTSGFPIHPAPRLAFQQASAHLSMSDPFSLLFHSLHSGNVSLSQSTNRGDLRSAWIRRFIARPLRLSGPHHSRRGHSLPSFHIG